MRNKDRSSDDYSDYDILSEGPAVDVVASNTRKTRVYVAGPYSGGDVAVNVKRAIEACDDLLVAGYAPYCPHLTHFWHMMRPHVYEIWLDLDNQFVPCCDVLLRLPGESGGADKEVQLAHSFDMLVFYSISSLRSNVTNTRSF